MASRHIRVLTKHDKHNVIGRYFRPQGTRLRAAGTAGNGGLSDLT